ncbi:peptidase S41 [Mesorhizobium waimense]|uniref:Peptidase S41 n=1 Tax=Mesorhizobium waimense TaxID=1300307 RepID=A0A3A5KNN1_9HYPH|nr:peptidase S41 [Mesorhizobium waimense]RJT34262.1 peptidase S41 [Mesorhizobium waimense]
MSLNRRHLLHAASTALACAAIPRWARAETTEPAAPIQLTPAQMREDLAYLRAQWAPLDQSFSEQQRKACDEAIADATTNAATSSTADFALDVMRAVAIPRNGHTVAMVNRLLGNLPVRTWWFADGLYIISVQPQVPELLGARIEKLGSLAPQEALARVAPFISGTEQRVRYLSADYLTSPIVLRRIGAAPDASVIPLTLRLRSGGTSVVRLGPASEPDPGDPHDPAFNGGWTVLIPDGKAMPGRWLHVLDSVNQRPLTYAKATDVSTAWTGDDSKVLYIRSNYLRSQNQDPLDQKFLFGVLEKLVVPKRPQCVIVDLRFNNGGNFFDTILFAQALPKLMPGNGRMLRADQPRDIFSSTGDGGDAQEHRPGQSDIRRRTDGRQRPLLGGAAIQDIAELAHHRHLQHQVRGLRTGLQRCQ